MKIKYSILAIILCLMALSLTQVFNVPPLNRDIYPLYKSGYFRELEREFRIIADSFLAIKTMTEPAYAWIFLKDIADKHGVAVGVYDRQGYPVHAPGKQGDAFDPEIMDLLRSREAGPVYSFEGRNYRAILPMISEDRCGFCHGRPNSNGTLGAMVFSRPYDGHVYYSGERIIIFIIIASVLAMVLFFVARWEPGKKIKELFDKS
jgi:hypothetical protein